jgi:hypothetical protein
MVNFEKQCKMNGVVTDREYQEFEQEKLRDISRRFRAVLKQIPLYEIAKGTGLKWDTVDSVRKGKRVSFKALCRIEKYIQSRGLML